jgi:hypothetical protein
MKERIRPHLLANKIASIGLDRVEGKTNSKTPAPREGRGWNKKEVNNVSFASKDTSPPLM